MMKLRQYQRELITELDRVIAEGKQRIIVVAPTGAGKTVIAAAIIKASSKSHGTP
jgi:superfamily II DNA or RNA helicase